MNKFRYAIVRKPCPEMVNGITTANSGNPDYKKALEQHSRYIDILKECGLQVTILEEDKNYPDSTFIEDAALCTPKCAVVTNPGAVSRNGEKSGMKKVLSEFFSNIEEIIFPGTLEAGDVMMVENHYYIGISGRTNHSGAEQLISILQKYSLTGSKILLGEMLHLKTGLSYLENNNLLISGEFLNNKDFSGFNKIVVDDKERYSANSLWINGTVIVPAGYPETGQKIKDAGYETIVTDVSEFQKLDGGLSCLSLRF